MKKVCIITASYGNGHITASNALAENIIKDGNKVRVFDLAKQTWGGKFLKFCFNISSFWLIEKLFELKNYAYPSFLDRVIGEVLFGNQIKKMLKEFSPNEVFSTFPLANEVIRDNFSGKFTVQITDYFSPHLSWGWGNPDFIFCLDQESKNRFEKYFPNISPKNIVVKKFPLSKKIKKALGFSSQKKQEIKKKLVNKYCLSKNFIKKKVLFLFFHHVLFGNEYEVIEKISKDSKFSEFFIGIVAGKNKNVFTIYSNNPNVYIFSWVDDIENFYVVADMVGGKCGGAFSSEVMAFNLPFIVTGVFSGQEKGNKKFLETYYNDNLLKI